MDGRKGVDGKDRDRDELIQTDVNVAHINLGMEPNASLAYDTGLEPHHLIMGMIG